MTLLPRDRGANLIPINRLRYLIITRRINESLPIYAGDSGRKQREDIKKARMANGQIISPGLSFPRETFAKLTPKPFLHAHLKQTDPVRPNGRSPSESRKPTVNVGSLTHSNGSALVRSGDTAIVCGIRAEILLASDIPHPPNDGSDDDDLVEDLGLLVPNVELSTGCSPAHLPGNPPGSLAQSLSYRILSLLVASKVINPELLKIIYEESQTDEDLPDEGPKMVVKAYWTLYIDILCISLDGNAFDVACIAMIAALQQTVLPKAWWDPNREIILCSPQQAEAAHLRLDCLPVALTFAIFTTASPLKLKSGSRHWILADPDSFEEEATSESLTITVVLTDDQKLRVVRSEKSGGSSLTRDEITRCMQIAGERCKALTAMLR